MFLDCDKVNSNIKANLLFYHSASCLHTFHPEASPQISAGEGKRNILNTEEEMIEKKVQETFCPTSKSPNSPATLITLPVNCVFRKEHLITAVYL